MTEWRDVTIGDVMVALFDGPHATPAPATEGPVYLGIKNITAAGLLDLSDVRHISEAEFNHWTRRVTPRADDVVFTYEATLHRYALIPDGFRGCLGRRIALIRPDLSVVRPRFLHFLMLGPAWRATVTERVISGSTVDRVPLIGFEDFPISIPDLGTQDAVVDVLGAIDDLIENNRRRIELLEQMAQAIYREWFVHFRYPGHEDATFVDSPLGLIPEGWTVGSLRQLVEVVQETVDPKSVAPATPAVGLEHIPRHQLTLDAWGTAGELGSRKAKFSGGDVLFGKIRPYFHKVSVAPLDGVCSTDTIILRPVEDHWGLVVMTAFSDQFVGHATQTSNGTKMPRANWEVLKNFPVAIPPTHMTREFTEFARNALEAAQKLMFQGRRVANMRDLLLPKLVTGQIDVSGLDLDAVVGSVA